MDSDKFINKNVKDIQSDMITTFNDQIADVPDLIPLTLGEPDFNTPQHIKDAAIKAIENNESHYSNPLGIENLRKAAVKFMADKYDVHYDPQSEVLATTGVSEAILDTFITFLEPHDEIIIPSPAFPVYEGAANIIGAKVDFLNTANDDFKVTPSSLKKALADHPHAKAIILNFPNNPTGKTYTEDELKALADVLKQHDIIVISDEIYSELTYGQHHFSLGKLIPDQTILFNGLSKSHAMTGWRLGVIFGPSSLINQITKVHIANTFNVPVMVQEAGYEAFAHGADDALPMKKAYEERRKIVLDGLKQAGIEASEPEGAFYIFAKIPAKYHHDSMKFCVDLAKEAHVGVIPGVGFGPGGEDYFRLSYAASSETLKRAMQRIQNFIK